MKYLVLITILCSSCTLFQRSDRQEEKNSGLKVTSYHFTVYADTSRSERIVLDSIAGAGEKIDTSATIKLSDYLEFHFLDKRGNTNSTFIIQHPLFVEVSYINEQGSVGTLPVRLPHQTFTLRKSTDKKDVELHVYERITGRNKIKIGTFDLTRNQAR